MLIKLHRLFEPRNHAMRNALQEHPIGHAYENQHKFIATNPRQR